MRKLALIFFAVLAPAAFADDAPLGRVALARK